MNRPIRKVIAFCAALFAILLVNATVVQVVEAHSLTSNPHNGRVLIDRYERQRGDIIVDGTAVALSNATNDALKYLRVYPGDGLFAHVTGFYSLFKATGVEQSQDGVLSGSDSRISFSISRFGQLLAGETPKGGNITLTLDAKAQLLAQQLLGKNRGAVVALDPRSGAILAMVSTPTFNPNPLTAHDSVKAEAAFNALAEQPDQPLLNRATSQLYPPGSTFKLIDTAAALSSGKYNPLSLLDSPNQITLPDTNGVTLQNYGGESCGGPQITMTQALTISCNTAYANLGLALGGDALKAQAQAFGFGRGLDDLGLGYVPSVFPDVNRPQTAQASIGQFDVRVTPLQMAMAAAAIGNGGVEMTPYVVAEQQGPKLSVLSKTQPQVYANPINATVAAEMTQMMESVVANGTGTKAQIPGVAVAGKTGTADHGVNQKPHSWFVAFAPAEHPTVAIAVLVEDGGGEVNTTGGAVAAPIAQKVMSLLLQEKQ
ncbi:MAG TPA: penicillin-binding protein 2 [Mycobacteriales bacterium]